MTDKKWYIVHTYSGHEAKVKQSLLERAKSFHHEMDFDEILIPEENVVEVVKGERRTSKRKFFPGYILVKMNLTDETWHIVKDTPKVTGFVGGGERPTPVSDSDVAKMTAQMKEATSKPKPRIVFEEGEGGARGERSVRELRGLRRPGAPGQGKGPGDGSSVRARDARDARLRRRREGVNRVQGGEGASASARTRERNRAWRRRS